jgi:surfactin synthase thioesterase subunit
VVKAEAEANDPRLFNMAFEVAQKLDRAKLPASDGLVVAGMLAGIWMESRDGSTCDADAAEFIGEMLGRLVAETFQILREDREKAESAAPKTRSRTRTS